MKRSKVWIVILIVLTILPLNPLLQLVCGIALIVIGIKHLICNVIIKRKNDDEQAKKW